MGKPGDNGEQRRSVEARLRFEDAETLEFGDDLFAQRVRRGNDKQALKSLTRVEREHGLGLTGARRHDDRSGSVERVA